ncbi:GntR family transcriptional regulator [Gryllotalpicola reticulitermitis]|uniref:GntR family transcriptional regulator n=1 Tax=Gryllotalpicola reticulitermitis TaxID=1184153 RepID=A0ABV8Q735_9MICO
MELGIDVANPAPASEQLRQQILDQVRGGTAAPGTKLPTVRRLADELGIAVNTVARAYRLLEEDGIVETFGRRGSFITAQGNVVQQQLQNAATEFARRAAGLGVTADEARAAALAAIRAQLG